MIFKVRVFFSTFRNTPSFFSSYTTGQICVLYVLYAISSFRRHRCSNRSLSRIHTRFLRHIMCPKKHQLSNAASTELLWMLTPRSKLESDSHTRGELGLVYELRHARRGLFSTKIYLHSQLFFFRIWPRHVVICLFSVYFDPGSRSISRAALCSKFFGINPPPCDA